MSDLKEIKRRDAVLRAFFAGKDWDENDEFKLKRAFVLRSEEFLPEHPYLYADEWEVVPGETNQGRGDLLFTDGVGSFAVVEVKYIDSGRTGSTVRTKRRKSRRHVGEQAAKFAEAVRAWRIATGAVYGYALTDEYFEGNGQCIPKPLHSPTASAQQRKPVE